MKQKLLQKFRHYTKEIVIMIVTIIIFSNILSFYKSQDLNQAPLHLQSVTLIDGSTYTIVKNKPIIIHFWATWCPTCKLEADNIERLSKSYEVLTIAVQSKTNDQIDKYLKENDLHFRVVNDHKGALAHQFHIAGFPTTFIYDKEHNLMFSEVGYTSTLGLYLRMFIAQF